MTPQEFIQDFKKQCKICFENRDGSYKSVREYKKASKNIYISLSKFLEDNRGIKITEISSLLTEIENQTNLLFATRLLEKYKTDNEITNNALSVIQSYVDKNESDSFIYQDWLKNYADNNLDTEALQKRKKTFLNISLIYCLTIFIDSLIFIIFNKRLELFNLNFLFFYLMTVYLFNSLYYLLLQRKIKKMTTPLFGNLSSLGLMVGLTIGIIFCLIFGLSNIETKMIYIFSSVYLLMTLWTGKKYWLGINWYDR